MNVIIIIPADVHSAHTHFEWHPTTAAVGERARFFEMEWLFVAQYYIRRPYRYYSRSPAQPQSLTKYIELGTCTLRLSLKRNGVYGLYLCTRRSEVMFPQWANQSIILEPCVGVKPLTYKCRRVYMGGRNFFFFFFYVCVCVGVAGWLDRHLCVNNIVTIAIFIVLLLYWHRNLDGYLFVHTHSTWKRKKRKLVTRLWPEYQSVWPNNNPAVADWHAIFNQQLNRT